VKYNAKRLQLRRPRAGRLVQNAVALIVSGGGTGLIGIVFWGVAAHVATAANIGRTSAEIAAMTLLATLAQLSFGSTFERFLPIAGNRTRAFVIRAYSLCAFISFVIATLYVVLGIGHSFLPTSLGWRVLFILSVVLWTIFALQDSVLIGLRATRWVPVENILYSLVKLSLIPAFMALSASQGIFLAWLTPVVAIIATVNWYLFRKRIPMHEALRGVAEKLPSLRELIVLTGAQYATLLVTVLSGSIVSLIVIDRLGAVASAHYYLPAQIAGGASVALWSIDRSFLVEASSERGALRRHARSALKAGIVVLVSSVSLGVIFAPEILKIFGESYEANGTTLLRMFLLSLPGSAVVAFYSSFAWLDKRVWKLAVRESLSAIVYFVLIFVLIGRHGILAIGIAQLVTSVLQGALFLPLLITRYRKMISEDPKNGATGTVPIADP
jgi:O-antigen/teichoic acid export membrane protein